MTKREHLESIQTLLKEILAYKNARKGAEQALFSITARLLK